MSTPENLPAPLVEVHEDAAALATTVAGELLSRLADLQAGGAVPHIGLTGGTIAEAIHREVARLSPASGVDWGAVVVWFGDERFVAPDSPDRNAGQARAAFLDAVGASRVHEMPSTATASSVEKGASAYGELMRAEGAGAFDILMLGIGPDCHVASLFPGHPALEVDDAIAVGVHDSPKPPPERISLTFDCLNRSHAVWFLASGEGKAQAVATVLGSADAPSDHQVPVTEAPAAGVRGTQETVWFLDRAAASSL